MYPYHNRIKQRIHAGELIGYHFTDNYPRIGPALVLEFNTYPPLRPIRPERWGDYVDILADWRRGQCPARNLISTAKKDTGNPLNVF